MPVFNTPTFRFAVLFAIGVIAFAHSNCAIADDWTQFRGPNGNGVVDAIEHPPQWSASENVAWSIDVASGLSSPIVIGQRVILTSAAGPMKSVGFMEGVRDMKSAKPPEPLTFQVECFSLEDGSKLWTKPLVTKMPEFGIHRSNSFATASPVTDGKNVYVHFASIGLVAGVF